MALTATLMALRLLFGLHWRDTVIPLCAAVLILLPNLHAFPRRYEIFPYDHLTPYTEGKHGSRRTIRDINDCQHTNWKNETYEKFNVTTAQPSSKDVKYNFYKYADSDDGKRYMTGTIAYVEDPYHTFSVLEPSEKDGCTSNYYYTPRSTVLETVKNRKYGCKFAANAGFFSVLTGQCLGNLVSDGNVVQTSHNEQNANFGIRQDGTIVVGYLSDDEILNTTNPFRQLVAGVIWLVRNGTNYVNESMKLECSSHEDTGKMETFVSVISARTALGHDAKGRLVMAQVEGQTHKRGANLIEFADLLVRHGVVNAINLDGGGSNTLVQNDILVNYPSDHCPGNGQYRCPRQVSTVLCVHDVECLEPDCSGHGSCDLGLCSCDAPWMGEMCEMLNCSLTNCSGHGSCINGKCDCEVGRTGDYCEKECPANTHGKNCQEKCWCFGHSACNPITGKCICKPGYTGYDCWQSCDLGFYGSGCTERCPYSDCSGHGSCSHVDGSCTCDEGWLGPDCNTSSKPDLTTTTNGTTDDEETGSDTTTTTTTNGTNNEETGSGNMDFLASHLNSSNENTTVMNDTSTMNITDTNSTGIDSSMSHMTGGNQSSPDRIPANCDYGSEQKTELPQDILHTRKIVAIALVVALATLIVHAGLCFLTRQWAFRTLRRTYYYDTESNPPRKRKRRRKRKPKFQRVQLESSSDCSL